MNLVGHIFAKDTRHLTWEVVVSVALTAGFAWFYPYIFMPQAWIAQRHVAYPETMGVIGGFLITFAPVAWWVLLTRLVQIESLVGDRQWWITKPYEWGDLLTAKLLFVLTFVVAPLLVAEGSMLAIGGFRPYEYLPSLGFNLLWTVCRIVLPLMAIATVTASFGKTTLTMLGIAVAAVVLLVVLQFSRGSGFTAPAGPWIAFIVAVCVAAAAIVWQYATRRVWIARGLLVLMVVLVGAVLCVSCTSAAISLQYPRGNAPLQLAYDAGNHSTTFWTYTGTHLVGVSVPVNVSGIGADTLVNLDSVQVTAVAPDGNHWTSAWEPIGGARYDDSDQLSQMLPIQIGDDFFDREKSLPLTLHLRFAVSRMRKVAQTSMILGDAEFAVPAFGLCSPNDYRHNGEISGVTCRAALRQPELTLVAVEWSDAWCKDRAPDAPYVRGEGWAGETSPAPAEFGLSPVFQINFGLSNGQKPDGHGGVGGTRYLCAGSTMTFTRYTLAGRSEYDVTFEDYRVPPMPTLEIRQ
ncbi:MAG: hypothetical protein WA414_20775 [Acidobacteriaceae bacterium]